MKSEVTIRQALPTDSSGIVNVLFASWLSTYPPLGASDIAIRESLGEEDKKIEQYRSYLEKLDPSTSIALVAEIDGKIVGICFGYRTEADYRLSQIYISPAYLKKGIGGALIKRFIERVGDSPIKLSVAANNRNAIDFYTHYGFQITPEKSEYKLGTLHSETISEKVMIRPGNK